ncbi:hypothetical protein BDF19DRAFT_433333 [Syncephalis fuscata]|nr:hypothetical protein BDF19DRAFT_433333 [Syncephalis fuscata]
MATMINLPGNQVVFEYLTSSSRSLAERRSTGRASYVIILLHSIFLVICLRNLVYSASMTIQYRRKFAPICCLIYSASGLIYIISALAYFSPYDLSCANLVVIAHVTIFSGGIIEYIFVAERAYIARRKSRLILTIGFLLIAVRITYGAIAWNVLKSTFDRTGMCIGTFPFYVPYIRFGYDAVFTATFCIVFVHVAIQMYCRNRTDAWRKLAQRGIIAMLSVIATHLAAMVCVVSHMFGDKSGYAYLVSW